MSNKRDDLRTYMDAHGLTQQQAASKLDVSSATINQYLQGKYKGDTAALDEKVAQLIARSKEKAKAVNIGFVKTKTAKQMHETAMLAHSLGEIYLIIGEAGLGKTMALTEYAKQTADVVMVEVEPTYNAKVLLQTIAAALGLTPARTNHEMMTAICDRLRGSERLLIVDEAELLGLKPLEILRRIHDLTGIGIVLAGMPRLRANLRGARGEYKQLYSRIGFCQDIKNALPAEDIAKIAEATLGDSNHNELLYRVSGGNARRLAKLLRGSLKIADNHGCPVDEALIKRMAEMLID